MAISCRNATGPAGGEGPGGIAVIWFNGLSATADAYFPDSDSLIIGAWSTGSSPNQIRPLDNGRFGILSSLSAELGIASVASTGQYTMNVLLPPGSNPYCFTTDGSSGYSTLLLKDSVSIFSIETGQLTGSFSTRSNPSGIEAFGNRIYVGFANWPDGTSPGGVSVYDGDTGAELGWFDTGENTHTLKLQPTGRIHCYSTTYQDDGLITVIDVLDEPFQLCGIACGGAPGEAVYHDGEFLSPDGFGQGGLVRYSESGTFNRIDLPFSPTCLAVSGDTLYATCFDRNMVYLLDPDDLTLIDSLEAGGEGPQGIVAVDTSS